MRTLISIFVLPEEIDDLEKTIIQLKKSSKLLEKTYEIILDVTLGISSELTDWENSKIPLQFFIDKFNNIKNYCDWTIECNFNVSDEISGCVSQRRISSTKYNVDNIIWLDTDIVFSEMTLFYILNAADMLNNQEIYDYVVTPEIVRIWDSTWDCIVNEQFINQPCGYQKTNDPFLDSGVHGELSITEVDCFTQNQPKLKFAGGWFTCISSSILKKVPIPESFGHYGLEDTFIMWSSLKFKEFRQFKVKNLVICEDYKYRSKEHYLKYISKINKKEDFLSVAQRAFRYELDKI